MRILLLADRMGSGGAETHIVTLARGLLRRGHTVGLFSQGGEIADRLEKAGVLCRCYPPVGRSPLAFLGAKRILAEETRKNRYEILHAHTRMTALLSQRICNPYMRKSQKTPANAVTVHARFRADGARRLLSRWGEGTIAVSEDLRAYVSDVYGLPAECVTVIPNGIDADVFSPPPEGKPEDPVEVLFVSRLEADCSLGAELLCRIAPILARNGELPPFFATIAGQGARFSALSELAAEGNLRAGRQILRVVDPRTVAGGLVALYRRASVFVGVSRAAMEASFCGAAVLLCGNEGYGGLLSADRPELAAGNFCCRGMPKPTADRLARDLAFLLRNAADRRAGAEKTCAGMRRLFSAEEMCRATEQFYRRLLWQAAAFSGSGEEENT